MKKKTLASIAAGIFLLGLWQVASLFLPEFLLPGIPIVARRFVQLVTEPDFAKILQSSFIRLFGGFSIALVLSLLIGLVAGVFPVVRSFVRSLVSLLQSIPPITWIPFLVIFMGFGNGPIVVIVAMSSFYPLVQNIIGATEHIDRIHLNLATALNASWFQRIKTIYIPTVFPSIIIGSQIAFGNAWRSLVAAEMLAGIGNGLGWSIAYAGEIADMSGVLAFIVIIGTIAGFIDQVLLEKLKRILLKWRYVSDEE